MEYITKLAKLQSQKPWFPLPQDEYSERLAELEMPTLEERRHQADMAMVHKLTNRRGGLGPAQWFEMAADGARATRSAANPRNLRLRQGR